LSVATLERVLFRRSNLLQLYYISFQSFFKLFFLEFKLRLYSELRNGDNFLSHHWFDFQNSKQMSINFFFIWSMSKNFDIRLNPYQFNMPKMIQLFKRLSASWKSLIFSFYCLEFKRWIKSLYLLLILIWIIFNLIHFKSLSPKFSLLNRYLTWILVNLNSFFHLNLIQFKILASIVNHSCLFVIKSFTKVLCLLNLIMFLTQTFWLHFIESFLLLLSEIWLKEQLFRSEINDIIFKILV
jgi:hypothetical protein